MRLTDKIIHKEGIFNCPVAEMWKRWSTHEGLKTFFGRDNKIELFTGGSFEIYFMMEAPEGMRGSEGCKILSFVPGKMISFSWNAPPHLTYVRNHSYKNCVTVLMEPAEGNKTKLDVYHTGWPDSSADGPEGKQWDVVFDYFNAAWEQVLGSLKKSTD